jgi:hypothetical protein
MSRLKKTGTAMVTLAGFGVIVMGASVGVAQPPPVQPVQPVPPVSTPEPAPNPVEEMRGQAGQDGLDAGLETIEEPPSNPSAGGVPVPALRQEGDGAWERPAEAGTGELTPEQRRLLAEEAAARARAARENEMPRMVGPNIPVVPLDLLFPPELAASLEATIVRETRGSVVTVAVMDRETATVRRVNIPVRSSTTIGPLSIKATACFKSAPEDPIEAWAYMEVIDQGRAAPPRLAVLPQRDRAKLREARGPRLLRRGWMIASSPAVTPVDHPIYDVWVEDCSGAGSGPTPVATLEELSRPRPAAGPATPGQETTPKQ